MSTREFTTPRVRTGKMAVRRNADVRMLAKAIFLALTGVFITKFVCVYLFFVFCFSFYIFISFAM